MLNNLLWSQKRFKLKQMKNNKKKKKTTVGLSFEVTNYTNIE